MQLPNTDMDQILQRVLATPIDFHKPIEAARKKNAKLLQKEINLPDTKEKITRVQYEWGMQDMRFAELGYVIFHKRSLNETNGTTV